MSNKIPISKSKFFVVFTWFVVCALNFVFLTQPAHAANIFGETFEILRGNKGLVPCGTSYTGNKACAVCDIFVLIQNIINLLIFAAMSLGTLAALIIGIRFLIFGSNEKLIQQTKQQFNWLVWGIVIVLGSWLFLNTLFNFAASGSFKAWNQIECRVPAGQAPGGSQGTGNGTGGEFIPGGGTFGGAGATGSWEVLDSPGYADGIDTNNDGYTAYINEPPEGNGLETSEPGSKTYNTKADQYLEGANLNGVETNRARAIIQAESSGNPNAIHKDIDGQSSYGLMQIRPDTARLYDPSLKGLSDAEIGQKLMNDPKYNIDLGTKYYNNLYQKYGDYTLASAAYNGGPMANKPSVNCPGSYRWQCGWDNNEHTLPNERAGHPGYGPTRRYVNNINSVYSGLSK